MIPPGTRHLDGGNTFGRGGRAGIAAPPSVSCQMILLGTRHLDSDNTLGRGGSAGTAAPQSLSCQMILQYLEPDILTMTILLDEEAALEQLLHNLPAAR